jgi:hypothetical protein
MPLIIAFVQYFQGRGFLFGAWPIAKAIFWGVITLLIVARIPIARICAFEDQGTVIGLFAFFSQSWHGIVVACGMLGAFGLALIDLIDNARKIASLNKIKKYLREMESPSWRYPKRIGRFVRFVNW